MRIKPDNRWEAVLFLIPLLVGVWVWADTSGHGDGPIYRKSILAFHATGILPLFQAEWYHPGHYLMVWPVFAVGAAAGCWDDPLHAIQLVNFLGHGVAAVLVYRTWQALFPAHQPRVALAPALALAVLPAWLWRSQEALSDVVGAAMVLGVIGRLLLHDLRGHTAWTPYLLTGFLAAWAFLARVSTVLFLPMMGFLVARLLVRHRGTLPRQRVLAGLFLGGFLPLVLFYSYLILAHGWPAFRDTYFAVGWHNTETANRLAELPATMTSWAHNMLHGMGLGVFLALPGCVLLVVRERLFRWLALLLLPYLAGVANNQAAHELRYMIPVMACVALGYGAIADQLQRWPGRWGVRALVGVVLLSSAWQALPLLEIIRTRSHFAEAAVRRIAHTAPEGSLLIGVTTHPFLCLLRDDDHPMPVRTRPDTGGPDLWYRTWSSAQDVVTHHLERGRSVFFCSEPGLLGFRQRLKAAGFREQVSATLPADRLRDLDGACDRPLDILHLVPPARLDTLVLRTTPALDETPPGLRLVVHAPAHAGRDYRVFVGRTSTGRIWLQQVDLPFASKDNWFWTSVDAGNRPQHGLRGLRGTIDDHGHAEAFLPARFLVDDDKLTAVAVVFEDADNLETACRASLPVKVR